MPIPIKYGNAGIDVKETDKDIDFDPNNRLPDRNIRN